MESDDSAPEDVPISSQPVDLIFSKRLAAKKIQQERKLNKVKASKTKISSAAQLKPLPQEVLENLSKHIPETDLKKLKNSVKKKKQNKKNKVQTKSIDGDHDLATKLPDFIPLDVNDVTSGSGLQCATNFSVGILDAIVKNPADTNYKAYKLYTSKHARDRRRTNVKQDFIKKTLIRKMAARISSRNKSLVRKNTPRTLSRN